MENLNFKIRKATIDDARGIAEVHVKTWQHAYKGQISETYLADLSIEKRESKWIDIFTKADPEKANFIAEVDGGIIGFCSVGSTRETDPVDKSGELYAIYIDPEFAGKGVGSSLMKEGLFFLKEKGYTKATLWVLETNIATREFYEKKGWKQEGESKVVEIGGQQVVEILYSIELK